MRGAGSRAALFGEYEHLGWNLVPVRRGEKGCRTRGWPEGHFTAADFGPGDNIALRCAALLGDTADIDLDCAEALELADLYLPTTDIARGAIFEVFDDPLSHKDRTL